ncbi:M23 family metallopeptidase [Pelolinea submarina]|uniref:Peptidase M23-like protein n=1 Tax=Pelolinea submarina TaxID=913107 RepID=A0A3E0A686_9CHLR|nr:M23 family metallopeptidase [Pelolinea submarina]REG06106.1 peptidase M23-like protein [Pelolinea submarina]
MTQPVLLQIPVHGFFICPSTPGSKIPSHGIDKYGIEYAIDFVMVDISAKSQKPYRSSLFTYIIRRLPLSDFYGWGIDVYSPVKGVVVQSVDGLNERNPVNIFNDLLNAERLTKTYNNNLIDSKCLLGNNVIIKTVKMEYIVLAHLQKNSVAVEPGQQVDGSSLIGKFGHSGSSTMPHLHLHAMDNMDFRKAKGIPIVFSQYYVVENGKRVETHNSIPVRDQIMFFD